MSFDVIALLFIAFSVLSSLVNKWREMQSEADRGGRPRKQVPLPDDDEEIDLSEWDIFREPEPVERPIESEFREPDVKRPISEAYSASEFKPVEVSRPVSEAYTGPEFRNPLEETDAVDSADVYADESRSGNSKKKERLRFDRNAVVNGILYQEILGPPKSDRMR